jgi:hypothetical protein
MPKTQRSVKLKGFLILLLVSVALLKSQSLITTGCDNEIKYYSNKFYGIRYGTKYDNWAKVEVTVCASTKTIYWNGQPASRLAVRKTWRHSRRLFVFLETYLLLVFHMRL